MLDKKVAYQILNQKEEFKHSNNDYDWLGNGIYFWENNYERAIQYAIEDSKRANTSIKEPFVLGAVIDPGNCLDLLNQKYLDYLSEAYVQLKSFFEEQGKKLPKNGTFGRNDFDFRKREILGKENWIVPLYVMLINLQRNKVFVLILCVPLFGKVNHFMMGQVLESKITYK
jgi:hypothetical protein